MVVSFFPRQALKHPLDAASLPCFADIGEGSV
jgi:hypothetical protein